MDFNGKPYIVSRGTIPTRLKTVSNKQMYRFSVPVVNAIMALDIEDSHPVNDYKTGWVYSVQTSILCWYGNENGNPTRYHSHLNLFRDTIEACNFLNAVAEKMGLHKGRKELLCFVHNLSHETAWLLNDLQIVCGVDKILWTKPHKAIEIQLSNGIKLRDSFVHTMKSLAKSCVDNRATHGKVDGYDHTKVRYPDTPLTELEQSYIEADVLGLCEMMYNYMVDRGFNVATLPMTATGINRRKAKLALGMSGLPKYCKSPRQCRDPEWSQRLQLPLSMAEYLILNKAYHGGHTAGNIMHYGEIIKGSVEHYDFASSYPAVMLLEQEFVDNFTRAVKLMPIEKVESFGVGWCATVAFTNIRIKKGCTMPCLPSSKLEKTIHGFYNNGKLLKADYTEHTLLHPDWECIKMCYEWDDCKTLDLWTGKKQYLPNGFRQLIQESYNNKSRLKGVDDEQSKIDYAISKGVLNSWYGMCVEQLVREEWQHDGCNKFSRVLNDAEQEQKNLEKEWGNRATRYSWGAMVCALAKRNLYRMIAACGFDNVLYCDTDSVFGRMPAEKLKEYNNHVKNLIKKSGFGYAENKDGKPCYIGVIDREPDYIEFRYLRAKSYCGTTAKGFELTLAGVPKKAGTKYLESIGGVKAFCEPLVFPASATGKLTAVYFDKGVNLAPVDYVLSELPELDKAFIDDFELYHEWQEELY